MATPKSSTPKSKVSTPADAAAPKKAAGATKTASPVAHAKGKANPGLGKPVQPDDKLSVIVGKDPLPRTELTKKVWEYIRKHNLQDAKNRQMINGDDKLKAVFDGKAQVSMFEMNKLVSGHLVKEAAK